MKRYGAIGAVVMVFASVGAASAAEAWSRTTKENGAAFYACASGDCGTGATLTCRVFPPETVPSIEAFTARIDKQVVDLRAVGRDIAAKPVTRNVMGERVLYRTTLLYGGTVPGFETGFLVGRREAFAIMSTATEAKAMAHNFDRFVARLAKLPVGSAAAECPP
jgi:hypothetical protein